MAVERVRRQRKFSSTHDIKIKRDFVAKSIVVCLKGSQRQFKVCKLSLLGKKLSSDSVVIVKLSRFGATGFPATAEEGGAAGVLPPPPYIFYFFSYAFLSAPPHPVSQIHPVS